MHRLLLLTGLLVLAVSATRADSGAFETLVQAARALAAAPNYSWRSTLDLGGAGGRMQPGPTEGRTVKGGLTQLRMTRGTTTTEAYLQGDKAALKTADGWKSLAEAADGAGSGGPGGAGNPGRSLGRMLQGYRTPAVELQDLAGMVKVLSKEGDAFVSELSPETAREWLTRGPRRGGGDGPVPSHEKGWVKFWIRDGIVTKYQIHVQGTLNVNGESRDIDRTTTVEIKDVGTTTLEVPEDAKRKLT